MVRPSTLTDMTAGSAAAGTDKELDEDDDDFEKDEEEADESVLFFFLPQVLQIRAEGLTAIER